MPAAPQPSTTASVFTTVAGTTLSRSTSSFFAPSTSTFTVTVVPEAWLMQSASAVLTAFDVTVAPETPSTEQSWASSMRFAISPPMSAPMPFVSPATSITTSMMWSLPKVAVTVTSLLMPAALAV